MGVLKVEFDLEDWNQEDESIEQYFKRAVYEYTAYSIMEDGKKYIRSIVQDELNKICASGVKSIIEEYLCDYMTGTPLTLTDNRGKVVFAGQLEDYIGKQIDDYLARPVDSYGKFKLTGNTGCATTGGTSPYIEWYLANKIGKYIDDSMNRYKQEWERTAQAHITDTFDKFTKEAIASAVSTVAKKK